MLFVVVGFLMLANICDIDQCISRAAILGHESSTQISNLGIVQSKHYYDPQLLETIRQKALEIKAERAHREHLDLTYIAHADRYIPEIRELAQDPARVERGEELDPAKLHRIQHRMGSSTLGQLQGILHRTRTIEYGERITLNVNLRAADQRHIDANSLTYLLADNDKDLSWIQEFVDDAVNNQLPDYRRYRDKVSA